MKQLIRSNTITITTAADRYYIARPAQAEPVPAVGAALALCQEIERIERRGRWGWGEVLRVQTMVGVLEGGMQ